MRTRSVHALVAFLTAAACGCSECRSFFSRGAPCPGGSTTANYAPFDEYGGATEFAPGATFAPQAVPASPGITYPSAPGMMPRPQ